MIKVFSRTCRKKPNSTIKYYQFCWHSKKREGWGFMGCEECFITMKLISGWFYGYASFRASLRVFSKFHSLNHYLESHYIKIVFNTYLYSPIIFLYLVYILESNFCYLSFVIEKSEIDDHLEKLLEYIFSSKFLFLFLTIKMDIKSLLKLLLTCGGTRAGGYGATWENDRPATETTPINPAGCLARAPIRPSFPHPPSERPEWSLARAGRAGLLIELLR
jgi:hypothetical protein